ncbi:MAG: hypothetical protein FJW30_01445 [Acidobacteria bacterium]|nr:hypothetical protein [Acidobacteriota bacterium]
MSAAPHTAQSSTLHMERRFGSPVSDVWSAWTDPEEICQWFGPPGYDTIEAFTDLRPGGEYTLKLRKAPDGVPFLLRGTFLEVEPLKRLVYTWRWKGESMSGGETVVSVEFHGDGNETELRLTHERFPASEDRDRHGQGWSGCFARLEAMRKTPRTADDRQRREVLLSMRLGRQAVLDSVRGLSPEQLAWKPSADRWSMTEVLEHLALGESLAAGAARAAAESESANDFSPNDAAIHSMLRDRTTRFAAPEPAVPVGGLADAVTAYIERRAGTIQMVVTDGGPFRRGEAQGPIPGIQWDRYQWLSANALHSFRHVEQLEELREGQGIGPVPAPATAELAETVSFARKPVEVYDALVSPVHHSAFTGAPATGDAREGGLFTAWDGYISGRYLELAPSRRIVCEWSTKEWPQGVPPSILELRFAPAGDGTQVTLRQSRIPADQVDRYRQGWNDYYWTPLSKYFS